jgi:hypothetical protein
MIFPLADGGYLTSLLSQQAEVSGILESKIDPKSVRTAVTRASDSDDTLLIIRELASM